MSEENNTKINKKHNGIISFWKFMFCIMLVIFHVTERVPKEGALMKHGRIGVEFFFLVSGYLMAKKALNKKEDNLSEIGQETIHYIWKKIKSFFPYIVVAFIFSFFVKNYFDPYTKSQIVNSIWNLFLVDMTGVKTTFIIGQTWYISAMLFSMLILYPLLRKYKKNFIYIIAPIIVLFVGGWISQKIGNLAGPIVWTGLTYIGTLRAFFELALGTILYEIAQKLKTINFTRIGQILLTLIEVLGFVSIFFIVNISNASKKYDFCMLIILAISITLAFSEKTLFYNIANKKIIFYLEKLSLPIYLNHIWIIKLIIEFLPEITYGMKIIIAIVASVIFSAICVFVLEKVKKINMTKVKRIFIENT